MFRCKVCGWLHVGTVPPDACPSCGAPADRFRPVVSGLGESPLISATTVARLRLLALVPATINSPFARHDGPRLDVVTGDAAWFDNNIPCMRACPVNTDVATYIGHVADGAFGIAALINREQNVFAGTLGRTCSRPCEDACRRVVIDDPIQIRALKRVATDHSFHPATESMSGAVLTPAQPATGRRVAVVGAGVAGLAAARELRTAGHDVIVFEREAEPGGLMRLGVPAWRLPRDVVTADIATITALGVTIQTGVSLGRELTVAGLAAAFDAVVIATGAQLANRIDESGSTGTDDPDGLTDGLAFLRLIADGGQRPAGPVVVIGGGYTAFDCARTARRLAEGTVTVAMRQGAAEPVMADEHDEALAEGIMIERGVTVASIEMERGAVVGVTLEDATGARRPLACSLVIAALGQRPDRTVIDWPDHDGPRLDPPGQAGRHGGRPNVWLAGDIVSGSSSFIDAIASAKRTAAAINGWLTPRPETADTAPAEVAAAAPIPAEGVGGAAPRTGADQTEVPRWTRDLLHRRVIEDEPYRDLRPQPLPRRAPDDRGIGSGDVAVEVETGLTAEIGQQEAARCLQCQANIFIDADRCILCNGCVDVCPYGCIEMLGIDRLANVDGRKPDGELDRELEGGPRTVAMVIDEDACIRCGKCVDWCPTSCITMSAHRPTGAGKPSGFDLRSLLHQE